MQTGSYFCNPPDRLIYIKDWFNEKDFIEYLNKKVCTEEKCVYVESIGLDYKRKKWPEKTENVIGIISK